jgi:DNA-directed RNA polymerase delta subunit
LFRTHIAGLLIMADSIHINLSNCTFGPEELNFLLEEWLKDPIPKTINELTRVYLTNRIKIETGYFPYDRRNQYQKGDTIIVKPFGGEISLARVLQVVKNQSKDSDGYSYDAIDVVLLDQSLELAGRQNKAFFCNYHGKELIGSAVTSFEIIKEKDETEVIPKILIAISNNDRFVAYQDHWLPTELLENSIRQNRDKIREIITALKKALSAKEILEKLEVGRNNDCLNNRLEFSVNYFLKQDRRFDENPGDTTRWDLQKPPAPIQMDIDKRKLRYNKFLEAPPHLDLLIFYHGFIKQCVFLFPYDRCATVDYDNSRKLLCGEKFVGELVKLSDAEEFKIKFEHPEQRGGPIPVSVLTSEGLEEKVQSTVTISEDWVEKGVLVVPKKISNYMEGTNTVHIIYDQIEEVLPYEENDRLISGGLENFYSAKAVAEFDKVTLRLESLEPTRLFISSTWQISLDKLLSIDPQDLNWEHSSLRDCIIVILAKLKTPANHREIYSEIAQHKIVSQSSIAATLSKYSPSVFAHIGWGKWQLAGSEVQKTPEVSEAGNDRPTTIPETDEEIWKIVQFIEEKDYVYKLLEKIKKPLSFSDICDRLADLLKIDANKLKATAFLKANDTRLRRLDDGTWALEEWFKQPPPVSEENISLPTVNENADGAGDLPQITEKSGISKLLLAILIIVLFLITIAGVVLIWLIF